MEQTNHRKPMKGVVRKKKEDEVEGTGSFT
jgi:hypothetical protein